MRVARLEWSDCTSEERTRPVFRDVFFLARAQQETGLLSAAERVWKISGCEK